MSEKDAKPTPPGASFGPRNGAERCPFPESRAPLLFHATASEGPPPPDRSSLFQENKELFCCPGLPDPGSLSPPRSLAVTGGTGLRRPCFICGRSQCGGGGAGEKSRNAKHSPQHRSAAITPAPAPGAGQSDGSGRCRVRRLRRRKTPDSRHPITSAVRGGGRPQARSQSHRTALYPPTRVFPHLFSQWKFGSFWLFLFSFLKNVFMYILHKMNKILILTLSHKNYTFTFV